MVVNDNGITVGMDCEVTERELSKSNKYWYKVREVKTGAAYLGEHDGWVAQDDLEFTK